MCNKYNEQEFAWKVIKHLHKPRACRAFEDKLRDFGDWYKNWLEKNEELLKKRKKLKDRMYNNREKFEKRLAFLRKELKKLPNELVQQVENEEKKYCKKQNSLEKKRDKLETLMKISPWKLVRDIDITQQRSDKRIMNLTKFICGDTPAPKISTEQHLCLRYVRLAILRKKALPKETLSIIAESVLDSEENLEEVGVTWEDMQNDWDNWHPVIEAALDVIEKRLKPPDDKPIAPEESGAGSATVTRQEEKFTKQPSPSQKKAWNSYQWISKQEPDLLPESPMRFTLKMYNHIKEHCPDYHDDNNNPLPMPGFESWKRYIRGYEQFLDGPRNTPRAGREQPKSAIDVKSGENISRITSRFEPKSD